MAIEVLNDVSGLSDKNVMKIAKGYIGDPLRSLIVRRRLAR
jgi:hypothetical protein